MTVNPIDNEPFTEADADRLLGLADAFLDDWEEHEGKGDPECVERRKEYDAIRPLLTSAPALAERNEKLEKLAALVGRLVKGKGRFHTEQNYNELASAYKEL